MTITWGKHPITYRTRKLSHNVPMILSGKLLGKVGYCQVYENLRSKAWGFLFFYTSFFSYIFRNQYGGNKVVQKDFFGTAFANPSRICAAYSRLLSPSLVPQTPFASLPSVALTALGHPARHPNVPAKIFLDSKYIFNLFVFIKMVIWNLSFYIFEN